MPLTRVWTSEERITVISEVIASLRAQVRELNRLVRERESRLARGDLPADVRTFMDAALTDIAALSAESIVQLTALDWEYADVIIANPVQGYESFEFDADKGVGSHLIPSDVTSLPFSVLVKGDVVMLSGSQAAGNNTKKAIEVTDGVKGGGESLEFETDMDADVSEDTGLRITKLFDYTAP